MPAAHSISGGEGTLESHLLMARVDPRNGRLTLDEGLTPAGAARPGVSFDRQLWPHGRTRKAIPRAVFSRYERGKATIAPSCSPLPQCGERASLNPHVRMTRALRRCSQGGQSAFGQIAPSASDA